MFKTETEKHSKTWSEMLKMRIPHIMYPVPRTVGRNHDDITSNMWIQKRLAGELSLDNDSVKAALKMQAMFLQQILYQLCHDPEP
jgi:hypothetical protein